jgi:glutamine amidotransferase PdxT
LVRRFQTDKTGRQLATTKDNKITKVTTCAGVLVTSAQSKKKKLQLFRINRKRKKKTNKRKPTCEVSELK